MTVKVELVATVYALCLLNQVVKVLGARMSAVGVGGHCEKMRSIGTHLVFCVVVNSLCRQRLAEPPGRRFTNRFAIIVNFVVSKLNAHVCLQGVATGGRGVATGGGVIIYYL